MTPSAPTVYVPQLNTVLVPPDNLPPELPVRLVRYAGAQWAAVHHGLDETIVLRNAGLSVDSPMVHGQFEFRARFTPFQHQRVTAGFLSVNHRAFCLLDLGLGKTACVLWAAEYLRRLGRIRSTLIVCPITTMRDTWEKEIFNVAMGSSCKIVYGSRAYREKVLSEPADYYIINHDGLTYTLEALKKNGNIDLVVVDECTAFKTHNAQRTRALTRYVQLGNKRMWVLTGTPMAHLPTDIWTMARLICPQKVPKTFTAFRDMTCTQVSAYKWVPRPGAVDMVMNMLEPSICYKKSEVLDMPPVTTVTREVENTPEQNNIIKTLMKDFVAQTRGKQITAINAAAQINKVLQVLQGVIITDTETGDGEILGAPGRLATTLEMIEASSSKTIVFATYRLSLKYLREELSKHMRIGFIDGSVDERKRAQVLRDFANDPTMRVLLAHPRTTSHGLTLTAASTIVWFGPVFSAETYKQAINRIDRPGQTHNMTVAHLVGHRIEKEIYRLTEERLNVQDKLLDLIAQL